jgi:hypothetical protein
MCNATREHDEETPAKRSKRPSGLFVRTDSISLMTPPKDRSEPAHAEDTQKENAESTASTWSWGCASAAGQLLATPKNCLNSARRMLYTAPCEIDGAEKVWMRLELRLDMETLVNGVGNGRLGWLLQAVRIEFARSLDVDPARVDVRDIFQVPGAPRTCVEVVVSPLKGHITKDDLGRAASDLMDQAERNRASVDCAADLMKLISYVEVKDHGATRLQWSMKQMLVVLALLTAAAHYYGAFAFSAGSTLGLRGNTLSSTALRGSQTVTKHAARPMGLAQPPQVQARQAPLGGLQQAKMLDPMSVSVLALSAANRPTSSSPTTAKGLSRKAKLAARRVVADSKYVHDTFSENPWQGTQTLYKTAVTKLATQTLMASDEDEQPARHTLLEDFAENAVDILDKASGQLVSHSAIMQKSMHVAIKAAHVLDAIAMHHPAAAGLASVAIISGVWASMAVLGDNAE